MKAHTQHSQRLLRGQAPSYQRLQARLAEGHLEPQEAPQILHCGWGRLLLGHTCPDPVSLTEMAASGVPYFAAFDTRLPSACFSRDASQVPKVSPVAANSIMRLGHAAR